MSETTGRIRVETEASPEGGFAEPQPKILDLELTLRDAEVIAALWAEPGGRARQALALSALRIGILALKLARGRVDGDVIKREGERLVQSLQERLDKHRELVTLEVATSLKQYFDPQSGHFTERVRRLVREGGEIEQLLRRQIGAGDSELSRTLASHMGEQSPLVKLLSPSQSEGFLSVLSETLGEALSAQRERILAEFSLDNKDSALARLVRELKERHGKLEDGFRGSVKEVMREFSLDNEDSALSRLVHKVERAQRQISSEFSLDDESSALARMRRELLAVLEGHKQDSMKFREDVRATLAGMQARKQEAQRSTRHGDEFEDEVWRFIDGACQKVGDVATHTGDTPGLIKNRKWGDVVVRIGPEGLAAGAKIAVEAKQQAGYDLPKALEEMEWARKNRGAGIGLFVFSRKTAPRDLKPFSRYGKDLVVVWDAEDPAFDVFLEAGLSVARALCTRAVAAREHQAVDFEAIERALRSVEKLGVGLGEVQGCSESIRSNSEKILNRVRIMRKELVRQVQKLDERFDDLKTALDTDAAGA
ncbi:MAG: hypothetical protein ACE10D_13965 [Planctomycetota bacterium]|nr:hypothetical protein [Planctomycetota bacterium]